MGFSISYVRSSLSWPHLAVERSTQASYQGLLVHLGLLSGYQPNCFELTLLGKPLDAEDVIDWVLKGLDHDYQSVIDGVRSRDTVITLDKLLEKLITTELMLKHTPHQSSRLLLTLPPLAHPLATILHQTAPFLTPKHHPNPSLVIVNGAAIKATPSIVVMLSNAITLIFKYQIDHLLHPHIPRLSDLPHIVLRPSIPPLRITRILPGSLTLAPPTM